jgi:hypothetical protein
MVDFQWLDVRASGAAGATPKWPGEPSGDRFSRLLEKLVFKPRKPLVARLANPID